MRLRFTPAAQKDAELIVHARKRRSPEAARRWFELYTSALEQVAGRPNDYPLAAEAEAVGRPVRLAVFVSGRGEFFGLTFVVDDDHAVLLRVQMRDGMPTGTDSGSPLPEGDFSTGWPCDRLPLRPPFRLPATIVDLTMQASVPSRFFVGGRQHTSEQFNLSLGTHDEYLAIRAALRDDWEAGLLQTVDEDGHIVVAAHLPWDALFASDEDSNLFFRVSPAGAQAWEKAARPDWSRFCEIGARTFSDSRSLVEFEFADRSLAPEFAAAICEHEPQFRLQNDDLEEIRPFEPLNCLPRPVGYRFSALLRNETWSAVAGRFDAAWWDGLGR